MLEGPVVVAEAIAAGVELLDVFVQGDGPEIQGFVDRCEASGIRPLEVSDNVLRALAATTAPQGVVAVARMPSFSLEKELSAAVDLVLVLTEVRDPGNAGTLVRSAAAAGAGCVVFTSGSTDPFGPKTVRASAGSVFKVPVASGVDAGAALSLLSSAGFLIVGASGEASDVLYDLELSEKVAILLGNEAWGFERPDLAVDRWASIPLAGEIESLNVGAAGAVFLFEAVRQRRLSSARHG